MTGQCLRGGGSFPPPTDPFPFRAHHPFPLTGKAMPLQTSLVPEFATPREAWGHVLTQAALTPHQTVLSRAWAWLLPAPSPPERQVRLCPAQAQCREPRFVPWWQRAPPAVADYSPQALGLVPAPGAEGQQGEERERNILQERG